MIHHISLAVNDPLHVAEVVAELWQGQVIPFPDHPGSYIVLTLDPHGTAIEFLPKGSILKPAANGDQSAWIADPTPSSNYTATHANIAVPISEAEVYAIADREGWHAMHCERASFFELIEFWIENEVMLELLPPTLMDRYLATMKPENLQSLLAAGIL
jgi:hypothetical protein